MPRSAFDDFAVSQVIELKTDIAIFLELVFVTNPLPQNRIVE
jgi:hypothetical protein